MKVAIRGVLRVTASVWAVHVPPLHLAVPVDSQDAAVTDALRAFAAAAPKRSPRNIELDVHLSDGTAEVVTRQRHRSLPDQLRRLDMLADELAKQEVEIRSRLEARREHVDEALLAFGVAHAGAGTVPEADLMHHIYWQAPLVRAETLARVLHVNSESQAHAEVDPRTLARTCPKCHTDLTGPSANPSDPARLDQRFRDGCMARIWSEGKERPAE